ncbi:mismatch repair endonuclease PMS2-like [Watersipora subatra]|uniref:mismatch repair endonuclease PMS2-like n=1 Tax=Watersipora subatra TaxID=2589382 RepID=UPI00355B9A55
MDIKPIEQSTVHRLCSGQVVLTLAIAVKELVENAVDAGASSVEVRLQEYGSKMIEVIDNGPGVEENNFEGLTLKHHTSKIGNFDDLENGVTTFGFRGEALSSLCALSKLTVCTRHKDAMAATRIVYDHYGRIAKKASCARQVGTTVTLENLFSTLPVRHKELQKNLKREFHKMVSLLNAYCIISRNVKITCSNTTTAGKRSIVLSTNGSNEMLENIATIFGSKQLSSLRPLKLLPPSEPYQEEFNISQQDCLPFTLSAHISSSIRGCGRGSSDRQYYYINGRPCEIAKLSRLVNEVYHTYNKHQYPCVFLNILVDKGAIDVNVTPDKRKIFMEFEPILLASVKTSLVALWEAEASAFTSPDISGSQPTQTSAGTALKRSFAEFYSQVKDRVASSNKKQTLDSYVQPLYKEPSMVVSPQTHSSVTSTSSSSSIFSSVTPSYSSCTSSASAKNSPSTLCTSSDRGKTPAGTRSSVIKEGPMKSLGSETSLLNGAKSLNCCSDERQPLTQEDEQWFKTTASLPVHFSLAALKEQFHRSSVLGESRQTDCPKFRVKISPSQNAEAEAELKQSIDKEDFAKMEVLGQFNLGFIICLLGSDIFIIDQHASDEKYNFEMLQRHTVIKRQRLLVPKPLNLPSDSELLLIDNLEKFHKNGFEFAIDADAEPTQRVSLTTQPVSKNWTFGKDDIDEILYMLREAPERFFRPSRVRAMFASRACRKSVMIGKPLEKREMSRLVQHMGEIEQPWNCPHGRPTMRYLVNLDLIHF